MAARSARDRRLPLDLAAATWGEHRGGATYIVVIDLNGASAEYVALNRRSGWFGGWRYVAVAVSSSGRVGPRPPSFSGRARHGGCRVTGARPVRWLSRGIRRSGAGLGERLGGAQVLRGALLERVGAGLAGTVRARLFGCVPRRRRVAASAASASAGCRPGRCSSRRTLCGHPARRTPASRRDWQRRGMTDQWATRQVN